jgi:ankyrin repeat protein
MIPASTEVPMPGTVIRDSQRFGPASEDDIRAFERQYSMTLPSDYRAFLLEHNGGRPEPSTFDIVNNASAVHYLYGLHAGPNWASLPDTVDAFRDRMPAELLPIGADPLGNQICLAVASDHEPKVFFWVHEQEPETQPSYENCTPIGDSFSTFLLELYEVPEPARVPWETAVRQGDLPEVQRLIDAELHLTETNDIGRMPSEIAAICGQTEVLRLLLDAGARPGQGMLYACQNGHLEAAKLLARHGAKPTEHCMYHAAATGRTEVVRFLLSQGLSPNAANKKGRPAIWFARAVGHKEVVALLREAGADEPD